MSKLTGGAYNPPGQSPHSNARGVPEKPRSAPPPVTMPASGPFVQDADLTIHVGDALEVLRSLPDESVHCCVTSPPYWGLRDYGASGQLGLEASPDEYVAAMVAVFREVRRVLRRDGTCWLNLGDSYAHSLRQSGAAHAGTMTQGSKGTITSGFKPLPAGMKEKDLVGIPWRVAFALQADGWYLRSDIIWAKPNPMPESVTDRPTKAHEYLFLLSKSPRYFFDAEAVREPGSGLTGGRFGSYPNGTGRKDSERPRPEDNPAGRNVRSVWEIATQPYAAAHFATFPEELPRRCILAGTSERGCCPECGAPWEREVVRTPTGNGGPSVDPTPLTGRKGMNRERRPDEGVREITKAEQRDYARQLRESPYREAMEREAGSAFAHYVRTDNSGARPIPPDLLASWLGRGWLAAAEASSACGHDLTPVPCVVLDPFLGSGTTALVARRHGRRCIGIELSPEYARLAADRTRQLSLLAGEPA